MSLRSCGSDLQALFRGSEISAHYLRIALHLYNVEEDVDAILGALARNRHLLATGPSRK